MAKLLGTDDVPPIADARPPLSMGTPVAALVAIAILAASILMTPGKTAKRYRANGRRPGNDPSVIASSVGRQIARKLGMVVAHQASLLERKGYSPAEALDRAIDAELVEIRRDEYTYGYFTDEQFERFAKAFRGSLQPKRGRS